MFSCPVSVVGPVEKDIGSALISACQFHILTKRLGSKQRWSATPQMPPLYTENACTRFHLALVS